MANPTRPEHDEMTTWYGGPFDPDDIDEARINARLSAIASRQKAGRAARRA